LFGPARLGYGGVSTKEVAVPESELLRVPPASAETLADDHVDRLVDAVVRSGPNEAYELLAREPDAIVDAVLRRLNPAMVDTILWRFPDVRRNTLLAAAPPERRSQWLRNHGFPEGSIGRLMEAPVAVFRPHHTARQVIADLESLVKQTFVTYGWITDDAGRLLGVLAFRELLFSSPETAVGDIMVANPFALRGDMPVTDAMKEALKRHFPVYPVCDAAGRLVGIVRGQTLFEQQAFELTAQAGAMVGVQKEERLATPWLRSLRFRHPWLQLNLLTAFLAAAVVGTFEETIDQLVVLAVFLPVLAGQSGNTGCQALAVVLRGITLGELDSSRARRAVLKEAALGLANGTMVGLTAGAAMYWYASRQADASAFTLAAVVFLAMTGSCTVSGVSGAVVPMVLRRLGADPATASSIFLTTATDVASMGLFLSLANALVL
jgi:magnesium transporter